MWNNHTCDLVLLLLVQHESSLYVEALPQGTDITY